MVERALSGPLILTAPDRERGINPREKRSGVGGGASGKGGADGHSGMPIIVPE